MATIDIPVHDAQGQQVDHLSIDCALLGGHLRPLLLKQAYVRYHANRRQGSAATRTRGQVKGSTRKLFRQKGSGNARHGDGRANLMRGGGHAFAKKARSWRLRMPDKMRRLANRNALLAKAVDGEIKLLDKMVFDRPSTKRFAALLGTLAIDRSCLVVLASDRSNEALSAANLDHVRVTHVDRLNAFDVLNHRFLLSEKAVLQAWIQRQPAGGGPSEGGN